MAKRSRQACRSCWEMRGPRWLAGFGVAFAVMVTLGVSFAGPAASACLPYMINTALPAMSPSGSGVVGTTLSTTNGTWRDNCPVTWTYEYQWYRGSSPIATATSSTYQTTSADLGSQITVQVTGDDGNGPATVTATGVFLVTVPLGAANYYPIWSHGPVAANEATGNTVLSLPTPSYPTATGALGFSLTYNSQQTASGNDGLGVGWMLAAGDDNPPSELHDHSVDASPSPSVEVDWPGAGAQFFQEVGSSDTYEPLPADGSVLTNNADGTWTLVTGDGTFTFAVENSSGIASLSGASVEATSNNNAQLSYGFDGSGRLTSVSYKETPTSSSSETLTFTWNCTVNSTTYFLCVQGPDNVTWTYSANASGQITAVNDGTRQLEALSYTNGLLTKIQNADDLDPTHSSPGYNGNHALALTYDSNSPARLTCLIEGPISGQPATTQPTCAGGGSASKSTWSFTYASGGACPALQTPAQTHSVAQGTSAGCTTLRNPDQQPSGSGITVLYDNEYRPLEYKDARLATARISLVQYDGNNQLAWSEDAAGNPTDYTYDPLTGAPLSVTQPLSSGSRPVTTYRYDEQTIGTSSTPGNPLTGLAASYWANPTLTGLPTSRETDPAPGSSQTGFSFASWPNSISGNGSGFGVRWSGQIVPPETGYYTFTTDSEGGVDGTHLIVNGIDAIENMTSRSAEKTSFIVWLQQGANVPVTLEYAHNAAGTSGATLTLSWACADVCSPTINAQQVPVADLRPAWGNQTSVVDPVGRVNFQHFLDPASGQPDYSLVKDTAAGQTLITSYVYDSLGRMIKKYMPNANANATIDSTTGNLTSTPNTNYETDYTYYGDGETASPPSACGGGSAVNQYGQLESTSIPNGGLATTTTVYNAAGLPIAQTNGKGTSCLAYDSENNLTSQTPNGDQAHPITYTYDPNGTQLTATNQNGTVTTYYDEAGRLLDTTDASGAEAHFCYDADSNTTYRAAYKSALGSTTCPLSTNYTTSYTYDAADELSTETDPAGHQFSFFYDSRGNLRGTKYPNNTFDWVDTNTDGWVSDQYNRHGTISATTTTAPADSNPLADYTYTYLKDGKRQSETRKSGSTSQTQQYFYDTVGRLSQINYPSGVCAIFSYDLDSNRTQIQQGDPGLCTSTLGTTDTYTYDPSTTPGTDEMTSHTVAGGGGTTNYAYTSDGQVSSEGTTSFTWNGFGQFASSTVGSNTVTYAYDPTGALMQRTSSSSSTTTNYLLGDLFETNGSGTITTSYTDGPAGDLVSYNGPPTSSSTATYLYYDGHGNLAAEANSSGTRTANHTYDPFGAPLDSVPSNTTTHRFTGRWDKQYDTATGLVLMGARPYDPNTGRFLAVDPIPGGSLNNYDYAGQDPVNNYDLSGQLFYSGTGGGGGHTPSKRCRSFGCKAIKKGAGDPNNVYEKEGAKTQEELAKTRLDNGRSSVRSRNDGSRYEGGPESEGRATGEKATEEGGGGAGWGGSADEGGGEGGPAHVDGGGGPIEDEA